MYFASEKMRISRDMEMEKLLNRCTSTYASEALFSDAEHCRRICMCVIKFRLDQILTWSACHSSWGCHTNVHKTRHLQLLLCYLVCQLLLIVATVSESIESALSNLQPFATRTRPRWLGMQHSWYQLQKENVLYMCIKWKWKWKLSPKRKHGMRNRETSRN